MDHLEVVNTAESIAAALRFLEQSAAERDLGLLHVPIEAEIAVLRLARHAAERIAVIALPAT